MTTTTDPHGWPDPARPGYPKHPERDGWHWLKHPEDLRPFPSPWNAELGGWPSGALHSPQGIIDLGFTYLGPCLTPAEVAAAVQAEREALGIPAATLAGLRDGSLVAVPREPTEVMIGYGGASHDHPSVFMGGPSHNGRNKARRIWAAMLAAAQEPGHD